MQHTNPKLLVQSLKGSKAQIVIAFLFARQAMTVHDIRGWTGLKRETIYDAMAQMEGVLFEKQIGRHGRETWLLGSEALPFLQDQQRYLEGAALQIEEGDPFQESGKRTSEPTTTTLTRRVQKNKLRVAVAEATGVRKTDSWKARHQACRSKGIGEPKASQIADLEDIDPDEIIAHVDALTDGETIGLAILRIMNGEPVRKKKVEGEAHPKNCSCSYCRLADQRKYYEGEFADYIEH